MLRASDKGLLHDRLHAANVIFWDFDGVIKESVDIKSDAYECLFLDAGADVRRRIRQHHESNGGLSRFAKFPIYLEWAGKTPSQALIDDYCDRFSKLVLDAVVACPWVEGVESYLRENAKRQYFVLVTATPQDEILSILHRLEIDGVFREVYGAPLSKTEAIATVLASRACLPETTLMIGDAPSDVEAAAANEVPFVLRQTALNRKLHAKHEGLSFGTLLNG